MSSFLYICYSHFDKKCEFKQNDNNNNLCNSHFDFLFLTKKCTFKIYC